MFMLSPLVLCKKTKRARPRGLFFFFNDTATTEIYTLSLHDALPIYLRSILVGIPEGLLHPVALVPEVDERVGNGDRKSTRLNSSHGYISYAVFCLKKKKQPCSTDHSRH